MNKATEKLMYECTIEGFINDFNTSQFSNDVDTINNAIAYILKYGMHNDYTKCDIKELIFNARNEVAKSVARKQLQKDPKDLANMQSGNAEDNEEVRQFLADPLKNMAGKFKDEYYVDMIHYDDPRMDPKEKEQHRIDYFISAKRLAFDFTSENFINEYKEYEKNAKKNQLFVTALSAKLAINDTTISASFNKQKAGFFEKIFNTTSEEYNNFKAAFNNYYDEKHELYGDDEYLKDAAMGYLKHKFPNITEDKLPTEEQIAALGGAGKERANFCLNVVKVYKDTHDLQQQATNIIKETELFERFTNLNNKLKDEKAPLTEKDADEYEKSAAAYLKFKFPNLSEGKVPTEEQIAALGNVTKENASLCLNSLKDYLDINDMDENNIQKNVPLFEVIKDFEKQVDIENKDANSDDIFIIDTAPENSLDKSK